MENIPLPQKIEIKEESGNRAKIIIEPLYPGYGTTIGNALRRVLLSSLSGAAITAIKINGVQHEFSTIPHVKEDVVAIILNLKKIRFKYNEQEPTKLQLKAKGEKEVTAADIKTPSEVEVVNPKQSIATLTDKSAILEIELTISKGKGFVPVENREKEKLELGTIAIDAIYTPVKNINFEIENVRVQQFTNYDRLILDITTDGTITPQEALKTSATILVEHFNIFTATKIKKEELKKSDKKIIAIEEKKPEKKDESKEEKPAKRKRGRPKKNET